MSSIYIHIPFCKKKCHYCNFYTSASSKYRDEIVAGIIKEISLRKKYIKNNNLRSIYFGGGTPSILSAIELQNIYRAIEDNFSIDKDCEITFEANPDDINNEKLAVFTELGINRLSIGIQSFNDDILKKLNRVHTSKEAYDAVKIANKYGIDNISIDLIYGIPGLSMDIWKDSLVRFNELNLPHLSSYFLTVEDNTALQVLIRKGKYPKLVEEEGLAHYDYLQDFCKENSYVQYEISNFSKNGRISNHNTNYWKNREYLGVGPSAHSFDGISRQWNIASMTKYITDVENNEFDNNKEILSPKDKFNEFVMLGLRTIWGVNLSDIKKMFGEEYFDYLNNFIKSQGKTDLLNFENNILKLSEKGKKYADGIASDIFLV